MNRDELDQERPVPGAPVPPTVRDVDLLKRQRRGPGPRLVAIRKAERIIRELAGCQDQGDLRLNGRRLVSEARLVVAELDATSREPGS